MESCDYAGSANKTLLQAHQFDIVEEHITQENMSTIIKKIHQQDEKYLDNPHDTNEDKGHMDVSIDADDKFFVLDISFNADPPELFLFN